MCPITIEQKAERVKHIGSSDAPIVLGLSPYKSLYDLWLEKTEKLTACEDGSEAAEIGNMLEEKLLDWGAKRLECAIEKNVMRVHPNGILAANHDALVVAEPAGLEAKTHGIVSFGRDAWGEDGTDEVPDHVLVQCQHQMLVSSLDVVWVPALIGMIGRRLYRVPRDPELCEIIEQRCMDFWQKNVLADVPPDAVPTLEIAKRIRREPGKITHIHEDYVIGWIAAKEEAKLAEKNKEHATALLLAALGDAEAGDCSMGRVTNFEQYRKGHTVAESTFRVLRMKPAKKEKE